MVVGFAHCRAAARAVRAAPHGREAVRVVRSRSVLGLVRSRGPLSVLLWVAAAEGRLVWRGPDSFALLERPPASPAPATRGGLKLGALRIVDRHWDLLLLVVPPTLGLLVVAAAALVPGLHEALSPPAVLWLAVVAVSYVSVLMLGRLTHDSAWLRRTLGRRPPDLDEIAAFSYPGWNWSVPLCHHVTPEPGQRLIEQAADRMTDLVGRDARHETERRGIETDRVRVREVLVFLTRGITTDAMRSTVDATLAQPFGPGSRVALRLPSGPVQDYRTAPQAGGGFFALWVGVVLIVVPLLAFLVASWESQACGAGTCPGRPADYPTALEWLAWRLLLTNAPGVEPATATASAYGWLTSLLGIMTVPVAWVSARLAIARHEKSLTVFDELRRSLMNTRVLLLTVTPTERDAVLRTVNRVTGRPPERSFVGNLAIYELGEIGRTTLAMVQCARQSAGAPGGGQATATEAIDRWRPDLVIMVGICYGLRDDWTPPHRLTDVVVATTVYDLDHRIQYDDRAELLGDRVSPSSSLVARLQAASIDFTDAKVHFGLMLSSRTLVDSAALRDQLKRDHSRALCGEMEAQGLYAAAADAKVPWIVVKAISDWGVDRDVHYEPVDAAANAAAFVLHAIDIGAFAAKPEAI
ncbi:hypothetical protein ACIODS_27325 [Micromonospora chalcea]|uniref:5'-methylthioadenosine/S-adenosylhomocysteine nucleosidase family protein n=1 Tax=Micromonospora chalcea TaxID=1874 RepID=UPI003816369A